MNWRAPTDEDTSKSSALIEKRGHVPVNASESFIKCNICHLHFIKRNLDWGDISQCDNGEAFHIRQNEKMRKEFSVIAMKNIWEALSDEEREAHIDLAILIGKPE